MGNSSSSSSSSSSNRNNNNNNTDDGDDTQGLLTKISEAAVNTTPNGENGNGGYNSFENSDNNNNIATNGATNNNKSTVLNDLEDGSGGDNDDIDDDEDKEGLLIKKEQEQLPIWTLACILSTAFAYGCIMTTLFIITLPVECQRIEDNSDNSIPKSVALGIFVSIAGITQLISPLIGALSDTFRPPIEFQLGQRMPYFCLGGICSVVGLLGQYIESYEKLWLRYGIFFFLHMIGLNISYAMMLALIPDQVPKSQTGVANGILALLLVTGSLVGFGLFHFFFVQEDIQDMYGLYTCIVTISTIITGLYAHDRDAELNVERWNIIKSNNNVNDNNNSQRSNNSQSQQQQQQQQNRRRALRRRRIILGPWILLKTMLYDPLRKIGCRALFAIYTIDISKHHDFFVVTISRLAYYCGVSVQTFFLYFLHDIIKVQDDPESSVAYLAILGQLGGTFICYPVGLASDRLCGGRRKPFVYVACLMLGSVMFTMIFATTMNQMTILCLTLGAANGIYLTMDTSLAVDTLPDDYDLSSSSEGFEGRGDGHQGGNAQLLGIWGVAAFLGSALGPMIGGPLLYLFGTPTDEDLIAHPDQDYTIRGYSVILGMSCLYFFLSAISLRWVKNPKV